MRLVTLMLALFASLILVGPAQAAADGPGAPAVLRAAMGSIQVPQEWDGIWDVTDSVYTCAGAFQSTDVAQDTICGGKDYDTSVPGSEIVFDCTGTATATTIDMTCTGSAAVDVCTANYTIQIHGTLSSGSYFIVNTMTVSYTGADPLCALLPTTCTQINSHGTRTGPAPTDYCATPVKMPSWGALKTHYR